MSELPNTNSHTGPSTGIWCGFITVFSTVLQKTVEKKQTWVERLQQQAQEKKKSEKKDSGQENNARKKSAGSKKEKNGNKKNNERKRNERESSTF